MNWTSFVCEETPVSSSFSKQCFRCLQWLFCAKLAAISPQSSPFLTSAYLKTRLTWRLRQTSLEELGPELCVLTPAGTKYPLKTTSVGRTRPFARKTGLSLSTERENNYTVTRCYRSLLTTVKKKMTSWRFECLPFARATQSTDTASHVSLPSGLFVPSWLVDITTRLTNPDLPVFFFPHIPPEAFVIMICSLVSSARCNWLEKPICERRELDCKEPHFTCLEDSLTQALRYDIFARLPGVTSPSSPKTLMTSWWSFSWTSGCRARLYKHHNDDTEVWKRKKTTPLLRLINKLNAWLRTDVENYSGIRFLCTRKRDNLNNKRDFTLYSRSTWF